MAPDGSAIITTGLFYIGFQMAQSSRMDKQRVPKHEGFSIEELIWFCDPFIVCAPAAL